MDHFFGLLTSKGPGWPPSDIYSESEQKNVYINFDFRPFIQKQRYSQTHAWDSSPAIPLSNEVLFISMGPLNREKNVFF
jgi:hypothetical protein